MSTKKNVRFVSNPIVWIVIVAIIGAGVLIALNWISSHPPKPTAPETATAPAPPPAQEQPQPPEPAQTPPTNIPEQPTKGVADAPVTIVEFSSFYCGWCARFAFETAPQIEREYIQPGLVKFVFRNFTGGAGLLTAEAGECAYEQGRFWEYHDRLFVVIFEEQKGYLKEEDLKEIAQELGLDVEAFARCLADDRHVMNVQTDIEEGQRLGVTGTPTFFINGTKLVGAQPFDRFRQIIEAELARQRRE